MLDEVDNSQATVVATTKVVNFKQITTRFLACSLLA